LPDLWKWTLASGLLAVILGILVLAWQGISILVAATLIGVYLLVSTQSPRFPAPARHGCRQADQA
jgi:uncharacterized membrane protein HdeD (DUF308 family)